MQARQEGGRRLRLIVLSAAGVLALLLFRRAVGQLLFQTLLAALLAAAARPLCVLLERRLPAGAAALLALAALLGGVGLLVALLLPQLIAQLGGAAELVPSLIDEAHRALDALAASPALRRLQISLTSPEELLQRAGEAALKAVPTLMQRAAGMTDRLARAFLSPVLAFYFLRDREMFCFQLSLLIPLKKRRMLLTALRVPAWLLLGAVMGVCDLIPYVGPYLGIIPIVLFSLPQGVTAALWAAAAAAAVQQIESIFLSPRLMSGATGLHPAYILLLLSAGGLAAGLTGMLLALPLFVCLRGAARALRCARQEEMP